MATLKIEGQHYQIDDAIANGGATVQESDQILRDALRPTFEIAAGAVFQRETRDGQLFYHTRQTTRSQRCTTSTPPPPGSSYVDQPGDGVGL